MVWQEQEAKQKFSELVRRAEEDGPQIVTRHGDEVVVVMSAKEFHRLRGDELDFREFLLSAPRLGGLEIERDRSAPREVILPEL